MHSYICISMHALVYNTCISLFPHIKFVCRIALSHVFCVHKFYIGLNLYCNATRLLMSVEIFIRNVSICLKFSMVVCTIENIVFPRVPEKLNVSFWNEGWSKKFYLYYRSAFLMSTQPRAPRPLQRLLGQIKTIANVSRPPPPLTCTNWTSSWTFYASLIQHLLIIVTKLSSQFSVERIGARKLQGRHLRRAGGPSPPPKGGSKKQSRMSAAPPH